MTRLYRPFAPIQGLLLAVLALFAAPAAAQQSDYASLVAAQIVAAMEIDRDAGKAAEGTMLTVDLEIDESGRLAGSAIVEILGAPDDTTRQAVQNALTNALAHFQSVPFEGLRPEDRAIWGHMRVTWAMGLHVGGYQP